MFELVRRAPGQLVTPGEIEREGFDPIPQVLDEAFNQLDTVFSEEGPSEAFQRLQRSHGARILEVIQQRLDAFPDIAQARSIEEDRVVQGENLTAVFLVGQSVHGSDPDRLQATIKLHIIGADAQGGLFRARSSQVFRNVGDFTFYLDTHEGPTFEWRSRNQEYEVVFASSGKDDVFIRGISRKTIKRVEGNPNPQAKKEAVGDPYSKPLV